MCICIGVECTSRPWGFELVHAYLFLRNVMAYYGVTMSVDTGFETLDLKPCELKA